MSINLSLPARLMKAVSHVPLSRSLQLSLRLLPFQHRNPLAEFLWPRHMVAILLVH